MAAPLSPTSNVLSTPRTPSSSSQRGGPQFAEVLRETLNESHGLRFSRHAEQRVERRGIELSPARLARLEEGVARATERGCRMPLVLVDDLAFVVSVHNKTVVTALDAEHRRGNVFTNIDSAVIA